jgi:hypothetical protein
MIFETIYFLTYLCYNKITVVSNSQKKVHKFRIVLAT